VAVGCWRTSDFSLDSPCQDTSSDSDADSNTSNDTDSATASDSESGPSTDEDPPTLTINLTPEGGSTMGGDGTSYDVRG
jgi:hypothetical protein